MSFNGKKQEGWKFLLLTSNSCRYAGMPKTVSERSMRRWCHTTWTPPLSAFPLKSSTLMSDLISLNSVFLKEKIRTLPPLCYCCWLLFRFFNLLRFLASCYKVMKEPVPALAYRETVWNSHEHTVWLLPLLWFLSPCSHSLTACTCLTAVMCAGGCKSTWLVV